MMNYHKPVEKATSGSHRADQTARFKTMRDQEYMLISDDRWRPNCILKGHNNDVERPDRWPEY